MRVPVFFLRGWLIWLSGMQAILDTTSFTHNLLTKILINMDKLWMDKVKWEVTQTKIHSWENGTTNNRKFIPDFLSFSYD